MSCVLKATLKPTLFSEKSDQAAPGSLQCSFYFWDAFSPSFPSLATTTLSHRVLTLSIITLCPLLKDFSPPQIPIPYKQPCLTIPFKGWITWSTYQWWLTDTGKDSRTWVLTTIFWTQTLLTPSQRCFMPSSSACLGFSGQEASPAFLPLRPVVLWEASIWRYDLVATEKWKSGNLLILDKCIKLVFLQEIKNKPNQYWMSSQHIISHSSGPLNGWTVNTYSMLNTVKNQ